MVNMSAKIDKEIHIGLVSIVFTGVFPYIFIVTLTSKISRVHPLTLSNMFTKFEQEAHNGLVATMFTSLVPYMSIVTLTLDP